MKVLFLVPSLILRWVNPHPKLLLGVTAARPIDVCVKKNDVIPLFDHVVCSAHHIRPSMAVTDGVEP